MSTVTVAGANGQTISLNYDTATSTSIAQQLAQAITAGVRSGAISATTDETSPTPPAGAGGGELVVNTNKFDVVPTGYRAVVNNSVNGLVLGNNDAGQSVLSGAGNLTYITNGGAGTFAGGSGADHLILGNRAGPWSVVLGGGRDTVQSASGSTVAVTLGGAGSQVQLGTGAATVDATAASGVSVQGGAGSLLFIGGAGADTVVAGSGASSLISGANGNNVLQAGTGSDTLNGSTAGNNFYQFVRGQAGGTDFIQNVAAGDKLSLVGYGSGEANNVLATQQVQNGSLNLSLTDGTRITLVGFGARISATDIISR